MVRNGNSISVDFTEGTPMKTIRKTLVSAIFTQFGSCFGPFDIAGYTQYAYIFHQRLDFFLFLMLVQISYISTDNACILSVCISEQIIAIDISMAFH
jgi:hypothetical protein